MNHAVFVTAAYAVSAAGLIGLAIWILVDQRMRQREIAELEQIGVQRRSARKAKG
ncbi:MAG: heme exporter protein CcmD [Mesorhizobium sp.]|nr:heme exporter protein CcmD [Mesorhizobium sp.]